MRLKTIFSQYLFTAFNFFGVCFFLSLFLTLLKCILNNKRLTYNKAGNLNEGEKGGKWCWQLLGRIVLKWAKQKTPVSPPTPSLSAYKWHLEATLDLAGVQMTFIRTDLTMKNVLDDIREYMLEKLKAGHLVCIASSLCVPVSEQPPVLPYRVAGLQEKKRILRTARQPTALGKCTQYASFWTMPLPQLKQRFHVKKNTHTSLNIWMACIYAQL